MRVVSAPVRKSKGTGGDDSDMSDDEGDVLEADQDESDDESVQVGLSHTQQVGLSHAHWPVRAWWE